MTDNLTSQAVDKILATGSWKSVLAASTAENDIFAIAEKYKRMEEALEKAEQFICNEYCGVNIPDEEHHPKCKESGVRQALSFNPLS